MLKCNKKTIAKKIIIADNPLRWSRGLMFSKKDKDLAMIISFPSPRWDVITMMFVFYSLDVFFLDDKKKVIEIKRNLKPWAHYPMKNKASHIIEVVAGKGKSVKLGHKFSW